MELKEEDSIEHFLSAERGDIRSKSSVDSAESPQTATRQDRYELGSVRFDPLIFVKINNPL